MNKGLSWAIVTLSPQGLEIAKSVAGFFPSDIYVPQALWHEGLHSVENSLKHLNTHLFKNYETIVYIMATGIVIREIAHCLTHKSKDPAVLVIDGKGEYVISLLSGHLGGANERAREIATKMKAQLVITTMSDVTGHLAVDMMAKKLDCEILSFKKAKEITAAMIRGEKVALVSRWPIESYSLPDSLYISDLLPEEGPAIWLTNQKEEADHKQHAILIAKNIVLGIGCRRGTTLTVLEPFILDSLNRWNIHPRAVKLIASIDIKGDEEGIINFASKYKIDYKTYSKEALLHYESLFDHSEFVKDTVGVGSVCETSGYLASGLGLRVSEKIIGNGMTLSIWEENKCYQL